MNTDLNKEVIHIKERDFISPYTTKDRIRRMIWNIFWTIFAKPFPKSIASKWKRFILRSFGAKVANTAKVYSSAKIFMPWNLEMDEYSCIGDNVDCYNAAKIYLGKYVTISNYTYLCTASHNIMSSKHEQTEKPIYIGDNAWIASGVFIGPGVTIGEGVVVGAWAAVFKDIDPWCVVGGNPAKFIKKREIKC